METKSVVSDEEEYRNFLGLFLSEPGEENSRHDAGFDGADLLNSISNFSNDELDFVETEPTTQEEISPDSLIVTIAPKKRKRNRYLNYTPLPTIVKTDVRRSFAEMYVNMTNAANITVSENFFNTYAARNLFFTTENKIRNKIERVNDIGTYLQSWFNRIHINCDLAMRIHDTKVILPVNGEGSRVTFNFTATTTMILDMPEDFEENAFGKIEPKQLSTASIKPAEKQEKQETTAEETRKRAFSESRLTYDTSVVDRLSTLQLLETPKAVVARGFICMEINNQKEITEIRLELHQVHINGEEEQKVNVKDEFC